MYPIFQTCTLHQRTSHSLPETTSELLLASLNQFSFVTVATVQQPQHQAPTVLAQGSLEHRVDMFTRVTVGDIRRRYWNRRTSLMIRRSMMSNKAVALLPRDKLPPQPPQLSKSFNLLVHLFPNLSCLSCPCLSSKGRGQIGQVSGVLWRLSATLSMTIPATNSDPRYSKAIHKVCRAKYDHWRC